MSGCSDCSQLSSCSSANSGSCDSKFVPEFVKLAEGSKVSTVIAVGSGKGGVGKSTISALLAVMLNRKGYKVGIIDADVTGPSMGQAFGLYDPIFGNEKGQFIPSRTLTGIKIITLNLLLPNPEDPVVWRGPVISQVIRQFYTDVDWGELDVLIIDMPPGTGDVPLTIFQSFPVDRYAVVTTPQDLVGLIVTKACKMAQMMNVPILGMIENMASFTDEESGKTFYPFGQGRGESGAEKMGIKYLEGLAINPKITKAIDQGRIELLQGDYLDEAVGEIESLIIKKRELKAKLMKNN